MARKGKAEDGKTKHPAFRLEKRRLDSTVAWFGKYIERLKNLNEPSTGDPRVDRQMIRESTQHHHTV